ncbi:MULTISPECIES: ATP-binding protein [unclassified Streptosporangium]|uniref:ATP-binding protein n=1 Tax=unclassified Streptosporangium TaxID=2632669 RepID=UPI002E2801F7|nr:MULTISPECIES: ATP-binding protein [unclassified Streptosporangium]
MSAPERTGHGAMVAVIRRWDGLRIVGQRDFRGVAQSAGAARRWVVELLGGHAPAELLETVELLVSEVVTNAVLHSDSAGPEGLVTVCVGLGRDLIHVEVIDDGSAVNVPEVRATDGESLSGRGLGWVNLLASVWGSSQDEGGGAVWFQLANDHASGPGSHLSN